MDAFIFKPATQAISAGHDPMEYQAVWGTNGISIIDEVDLAGMHVDPVIPGAVDSFDDPLLG